MKELRNVIYGSEQNFNDFVAFQVKEEENGLIPNTSFYELSRYDQQAYVIKNTQKHRKVMDIDSYLKKPPSEELFKPTFMAGGIG